MVADGTGSQGAGDNEVYNWRVRCARCRDQLRELARIHLAVDAPTRKMQPDEPDWIGRMRKICLHVRAIDGWEIGDGVEHVMATEVRAAYQQLDAVWEYVPATIRLDRMDDVWADASRTGILAVYDHPTPQSLMLPSGQGGFRNGENSMVYAQLTVWLIPLVLGYGLALVHLAQVLGAEGDITSRVTAVLNMLGEGP